jgi:hypothetical protein
MWKLESMTSWSGKKENKWKKLYDDEALYSTSY